jgi:NADPH:quinone reductase-like Zn-dependent oxidoreductase/acyl carrier protein
VHAKEEGVPPPAAGLSPAGALLWGLGRTIANEQSELACTRVDLAPTAGPHELDALCRELQADDPEQEVALRPGGRFVGRLIWQAAALTASERVVPAQRTPFRLDIDIPGVLDRLKLRASQRRAPGPGEVEIEVEAAGLNFLDVLTAMGIGPGQQPGAAILGRECAGRITAVGEGVEGLAVGEPVLALASRALASHVTTQARWVVRRPPRWSAAQAAAIPVVYLTAYYGLITLGRLRRGERVLIHSAAGGTGLAAVRLAQAAGAEIFATAGSAEKRDFLRGIGVPHVMDSRSLDFAAEILQRTGGRGVDVVLNSLTGAAIEKSLSALAPYGRFIEIGKRDIYDNAPLGLGHFRKRLSYHAVDLGPMMEDRPHEIDELLRHVVREIDAGKLLPLPVQEFPISQAHAAFHRMAQGAHIGKLVLTLSDPAAQVAVPTAADFTLPADGTYLITGGLGGLGLALAAWMVDRGCRHLALLSRHGAQSPAQHAALAALQEAGAEVEVITADVAQRAEVAAALAALRARLPALRGIVHAAGVVEDGLLLHQDMQRFGRVMAPKVLGAWNLHELTRAESLDFFVLYSSAAALLGMPGQGNYAAANAFLDALAHHRRAQGLPALSINWGPLGEAGMAVAQPNRGARLATIGFTSLSLAQAHEELAHLLQEQPIQAGVLILDARQWVQYYPQVAASTLLSEIVQEAGQAPGAASGDQSVRKEVQAAPPEQRSALLAEYLREQLGRVLRLRPADIDRTRTFRALGVDSLMGLELRNRLEAGLGLVLPVTLIWAYPSVQALAEHLVAKLCPESASGMRTEASAQADELAAGLQQLSDEELLLAAGAALAGQADEN